MQQFRMATIHGHNVSSRTSRTGQSLLRIYYNKTNYYNFTSRICLFNKVSGVIYLFAVVGCSVVAVAAAAARTS